MNIFGFEIKSKEEREQEEREYLHRIFPGGTAQKAAVEQQLREKLPKEDKKAVMLYYILVKDAMTAGNGMSFEEAVGKVSKKQRILKLTPVWVRPAGARSLKTKNPARLTPARFSSCAREDSNSRHYGP